MKKKRALVILVSLYFIQGIIHNLGHPITPDYVTSLGIPSFMFGCFFAAMALGLTVGSLVWGYLSDSVHRPTLVIMGIWFYSLFQYLFGSGSNMVIMTVYRFGSGFFVSSSIVIIMAYLVEQSEPFNRKKYLGYLAAFFLLGSTIGYYIGGQLPILLTGFSSSDLSPLEVITTTKTIFTLQAIINIVHGIWLFGLLALITQPKRLLRHERVEGQFKTLPKDLKIFLIALAVVSTATININKFTEVYMAGTFNLGADGIGNVVFVTGIVSILTTLFIVPYIHKVTSDISMIKIIHLASAVLILIVFILVPKFLDSSLFVIALYSVYMIYIIGQALFRPIEQHYISNYSEGYSVGYLMGTRQSFFSIGLVIGPLIGGFLYDASPVYLYGFSVVLFILGFYLLLIIQNKK
jgi:DHA1 family multidrug resistance protein-like MFS transporter